MKTLVIRFSSLGDCILLCPLLAHLKASGAEEVTVVTKTAFADVFANADGVDRVVAFDPAGGLVGLLAIARDLSAGKYTVIDAHNNWRSRLLAWRAGGTAARMTKYYRERLGLIVLKRPATIPSILEQYARLARATGSSATVPTLAPGGITVPAAALERVAATPLPPGRRAVAMAPGSRWPMKRWGANRYLTLARALTDTHGCHIVLVGDSDDADVTRTIATELGEQCTDVAGRVTLMETAAWIQRCAGFVGNDSGLMHLAEAVGVPVLGLFGPTVEAFGYYPALADSKTLERTIACRPCSRNGARPCPRTTQECLTVIDAGVVEAAVVDMLERRGARRYLLQ